MHPTSFLWQLKAVKNLVRWVVYILLKYYLYEHPLVSSTLLSFLDNRAKAEKVPPLTPVVYGLSKCHTLPLQAGKDATLSCKTRGMLRYILFHLSFNACI